MKNQIDKFFLVLGAISLAAFNAIIPKIFLHEAADFIDYRSKTDSINTANIPFTAPKSYKPHKYQTDTFRSNLTSPQLTLQTSLYEKKPQNPTDPLYEEIPEYDLFINYSVTSETIITAPPTSAQTSPKEITKCEKPKVAVESRVGKININITPGSTLGATLSEFNIYRNDKGENNPYITAGVDELTKTDDKVEPDKDYTYKVQQVCTTKDGQKIVSEFSDEQTTHAKRKFYLRCSNYGTTTRTAYIHVQQYNDDGTMVEGTSPITVKKEIKIPSSKISTDFILISVKMSGKVKYKGQFAPQFVAKYCRLNPQKSEEELEQRCEDDSIVEMPCEFDDFKPKEPQEKPKEDKEKEEKDNKDTKDKDEKKSDKPEEKANK